MTWKCFPHYWLSLRGSTEHGWPSSQNCWAPMFSTLLAKASCWTNSWVVSDLKHYDTYVTSPLWSSCFVSDKLKHVSIKIPLNVILNVGWLSWLSLYDLGGGGGGGLCISKTHMDCIKNHIFQCMGKIFCVEFQRYPLKFHTKYLVHTLKDVYFMHRWKFKSS